MNFAEAVRADAYRPLPVDWSVGFSDGVGSTKAVADGGYKAVNMVGAGAPMSISSSAALRPQAP